MARSLSVYKNWRFDFTFVIFIGIVRMHCWSSGPGITYAQQQKKDVAEQPNALGEGAQNRHY